MSARTGSAERHVIPRWRSIQRTIAAGEIQVIQPRELNPEHLRELERFEAVWHEEQTDLAAAEFAAACVIAREPQRANEVVGLLQAHEHPPFAALANALRQIADPGQPSRNVSASHPSQGFDLFRSRIAEEKLRVAESPRNVVAWCNLARRYTALGQFGKAEQAMVVALSLAPASRYVLRSAARCFVQMGQADRAYELLRRSPRTLNDPWLLASAMSTGTLASREPPSRRQVRRLLESGRFAPIEQAELLSEFATVELKAGADRRARGLFVGSLDEPTDNSLAQVQWAKSKLTSLEIEPTKFAMPFASEARARSAMADGQWELAMGHATEWIDDQPFDAEATIMASYIAAVGLQDYSSAKQLAEFGLRANPTTATLRNNLAYALIELGELAEARQILSSVVDAPSENIDRVAIVATEGLYLFRIGEIDAGRVAYSRAIQFAHRTGEKDAEAMARSMLLREEVRLGEAGLASAEAGELSRLRQLVRDPGVVWSIERSLQLLPGERIE